MRMPPDLRSPTFILSAAGFMATRTSRSSPGVNTSFEEKLSWKALTPASVPAGARISAGKSGRVARSLPASADSVVNCMPVTCMPSPESPAKRMTTVSRVSTRLRGLVTPSSIGLNLYRGGWAVAILTGGALRRRADARRGGGLARDARGRPAAGRTRGHRGGRREPRRHTRRGAHARRPRARGAARAGAANERRRGRGVVFEGLGGYPLVPLMEDVALSRAMKRAGRVACLSETVTTSARRWRRHGVARTVLLMWALRAAYYAGVPPARLARVYPDAR